MSLVLGFAVLTDICPKTRFYIGQKDCFGTPECILRAIGVRVQAHRCFVLTRARGHPEKRAAWAAGRRF